MKVKKIAPLLILAVIWGSYYVASQQTVKQMSVFTTGIVIRFLTMILLLVIMQRKDELKALKHVKGVLPKLLLIGVLGFLLDLTAFIGLSLSPACAGTALLKCDIIFVNLISVIIYKRKFSKWDWIFSLVMLFGVFMVLNADFTKFQFNIGYLFFILSALFVSINAFVIKSAQLDRNNPQPDDVVAFYNNFVTMILFTATACAMGVIGDLAKLGSSGTLVLSSVLAGLGQTGIYLVYYYDLRHFPVWIVKVFLLFMPIVAALISFLLFGEKLIAIQYLGIAVVLLGALGILVMQQRTGRSGEAFSGR